MNLHGCTLASEIPARQLLSLRIGLSGCGYGSRCEDRVCPATLNGRGTITLVQYAAYLSSSTVSKEMLGNQGYNSILITLVRVALHFFSPGKLHRSPDGIPPR